MKIPFLMASLLALTIQSAVGQRLLFTSGYTRVGEESFTGTASAGLQVALPLGQHLAAGIGLGVGRNRQAYQEFIPGFAGVGGRTITTYHNFLYSLQILLAGRFAVSPRFEATLGPSAGFYLIGARERSDELKPGFGLWSNLTYKRIGESRFNLEAVFHSKRLLRSTPVEDADFRFDNQRLFVWDAQVGISYDLKG